MRRRLRSRNMAAFTLVELLVSMFVLIIIFLITASIIEATQRAWRRTDSMISQYREARTSFETMGRRIAQAQLNPRLEYEYEDMLPIRYRKGSKLHFVCGPASELIGDNHIHPGHAIFFQAPLGMTADHRYRDFNHLLNAWGYFIEFGSDEAWMPGIARESKQVQPRYRFRLMEFRQPSEELSIYKEFSPAEGDWYRRHLAPRNVAVIAENVIGLVIAPQSPGDEDPDWMAPNYAYSSQIPLTKADSTLAKITEHELPPVIRMTLIAIDEDTAIQQQGEDTKPPEKLQLSAIAPFTDAQNYENDMKTLEAHLRKSEIEFRVFSTSIAIRNAKWKLGE